MERFFQILAVILAGIAAYFLWRNNKDAGFATAVFAAVAFFLSVRFQVKGRLKQREMEREEEEMKRWEEEAGSEADEEIERKEEDEIQASSPKSLNDAPADEQIRAAQRTTDERPRTTDKELL